MACFLLRSIAARHRPRLPLTVRLAVRPVGGDVPRFSSRLKPVYPWVEFVDDPDQNGYGSEPSSTRT